MSFRPLCRSRREWEWIDYTPELACPVTRRNLTLERRLEQAADRLVEECHGNRDPEVIEELDQIMESLEDTQRAAWS